MTAVTSVQLHCHHCQRWLGESRDALTFVGMFKDPRQRERVSEPRDSWRCKSCGWCNVFHEASTWRDVELKRAG